MTDEELHQYVEGRIWRWLGFTPSFWNSLPTDLRNKLHTEVRTKIEQKVDRIPRGFPPRRPVQYIEQRGPG
jgi:hypothetical protein